MSQSKKTTGSRPARKAPASHLSRNVLALAVLLVAAGTVYINYGRRSTPIEPEPLTADATTEPVVTEVVPSQRTAADEEPPLQLPPETAEVSVAGGKTQLLAPGILVGREALSECISLLESGYETLLTIPDYTATFFKQERINGELRNEQVMHLKLRHQPFSVYLKWLVGDKGREVLYVDGRHDGKLLVRAGGWKGRLLPALHLEPQSALAMKGSRYPITKVGILELVRTLIEDRRNDLQRPASVRCQMIDDRKFNDRVCYYFDLEYESRRASQLYRKSSVYIDKEWSLPINIKNYTWPGIDENADQLALDDTTLIEHYAYSNLQLNAQLADDDFERSNNEYHFRR